MTKYMYGLDPTLKKVAGLEGKLLNVAKEVRTKRKEDYFIADELEELAHKIATRSQSWKR